MSQPEVVFLDQETLSLNDLDFRQLDSLPTGMTYYDNTRPGEVSDRIAGKQVVITNKVVLDADLISSAAELKLICVAATGTNNVDLDAAGTAGVQVCNIRDYARGSVVQHVFTLMLALVTRLEEHTRAVEDKSWSHQDKFCILDYPSTELAGKTLGIVGYGVLGEAVADVARAFGMEVLIANRPGASETRPDRIELTELLPQVDILSLHCPLADNTANLVNAKTLALMQPHAYLINTARGGLVDEAALIEALKNRRLAGAGLDVVSIEPPPADLPILQPDIPGLLITPHVAWAARESRQRLLDQVASNIRSWLDDDLNNRVV